MKPALPFDERLAIGTAFEELASDFLISQGFPIGLHRSREQQWAAGESAAHCEIKKDQRWKDFGNLFIEIRERRHSGGTSAWRPSGIYDEHNPWFYLIGDHTKLWLMSVTFLIHQHRSDNYKFKKTETAEGFVLPVTVADKWAIKTFSHWCKDSDEPPLQQRSIATSGNPSNPSHQQHKSAESLLSESTLRMIRTLNR